MRRNRIKAVINVPRGGRPAAALAPPVDRPLTPINSNSNDSSLVAPIASSSAPSPLAVVPSRSQSPFSPREPYLTIVRSSPEKQIKSPVVPRPPTPVTSTEPQHFSYFSAVSPGIPISPGGIQRPSPSASPGRYYPPSPVKSLDRTNKQFSTPFNCNSNSADSHEVARYMSSASPRGEEFRNEPSRTNTPGMGAFSSIAKDPANSIVNNSDLLRERLARPSPALTISKYQTLRKEFMAKGNAANAEKKALTMLHFAFWNPSKKEAEKRSRASSLCSEGGDEKKLKLKTEKEVDSKAGILARRSTVGDVPRPTSRASGVSVSTQEDSDSGAESTTSKKTEPEPPPKANLGPRVKVGPDGQLIIDEQSLVVETSESQRAKKQLSEMETVSGSDFAVGSSGMFRNKKKMKRGLDWSDKETVKFYKALSMCGTDFSMMTTLFSHRSRAELKAKFKREDKKNPSQISLALSCQEFDADEGITTDEEEEPEVEKEVGKNGKLKRVRPKKAGVPRRGKKRILSESDRRLQEELEETRAIFSKDSSSPLKPHSQNFNSADDLKKPFKKRAGGRVPSWKTTAIIDDDTLEIIDAKPRFYKKLGEVDKEGEKSGEKLTKKPRVALLNLKDKKRLPPKKRPSICLSESSDNDSTVSSECTAITKFDETDPLGLKVILPGPSTTVEKQIDDETSKDDDAKKCSEGEEESQDSQDEESSFSVKFKKKKAKLPKNVKADALPVRVPGPGTVITNKPSVSVVDEIEIEILCQ